MSEKTNKGIARIKIYLAARYSRREELCGYRTQLQQRGYTVTSRWLNGGHQIDHAGKQIGGDGEHLVEDGTAEEAKALRRHFAVEDVEDVYAADMLIAFTEQPRSGHSRGGRHVEFGLAIARGKKVIVVGPRENVFCWLPEIEAFDSFEELAASTFAENHSDIVTSPGLDPDQVQMLLSGQTPTGARDIFADDIAAADRLLRDENK